MNIQRKILRACAYVCVAMLMGAFPQALQAQALPGPADPARIQERVPELAPAVVPQATPAPVVPTIKAPEASKKVKFTLRSLTVENMHAFSPDEVRDVYAGYIDREVTLDVMWVIAGRLTERYRSAGYFLSRVYVPAQEIESGHIRLRAVEGYVHEIDVDADVAKNKQATRWIHEVREERPLKVATLESILLRLNDLPGQDFRAVLETPDKDAPEGAVRLNLRSVDEPRFNGRTSFDNYGSRFLGPYEITQQLNATLLPNQRTSLSFLGATQVDELRYFSFNHEVPLSRKWDMDLTASRTLTEPGYTLQPQDIDSVSDGFGIAFTHHVIRQRQENLDLRFSFDGRSTKSDLLGGLAPLTRDQVRALRAGAQYQNADSLGGTNLAVATLSQGIKAFGSSEKDDLNLSRAEAEPDFTKLEFGLTRWQGINEDWMLVGGLSGQIASAPLYSSEEVGYGGQAFGRAYDSSEITGDHGLAVSLEMRYAGIPKWQQISFSPYAFYDAGVVWNDDTTQDKKASGSSAGAGMRVASDFGISANLGVAFPLTRDIATPLYGNDEGPRYLMQMSYDY